MFSYFLRRDDLLTGGGAVFSAFSDTFVRLLGFVFSISSWMLSIDCTVSCFTRERDERVTVDFEAVPTFSLTFFVFERVVRCGAGLLAASSTAITVMGSFLAREARVVREEVGAWSVGVVLLARVAVRVVRRTGTSTDG